MGRSPMVNSTATWPSSEVLWCFHVHDGLGIRPVQLVGISVAPLSQEDSPAISVRAQKPGAPAA